MIPSGIAHALDLCLIQVPADEQPIILLVEQTVGGYTKIATIISSDLLSTGFSFLGRNTI